MSYKKAGAGCLVVTVVVLCAFFGIKGYLNRGYWNVVHAIEGQYASAIASVKLMYNEKEVSFHEPVEIHEFQLALERSPRAHLYSETYRIEFVFEDASSCELDCYLVGQSIILSVSGYALEKHWPSHELKFPAGSVVVNKISNADLPLKEFLPKK